MPIYNTIKGDLIKYYKRGRYDGIIHGCNCFNKMGAGIARQIAKEFPSVWKADIDTLCGDAMKLGTYSFVSLPKGFIINAYTQWGFSRDCVQLDYTALKGCFETINEDFRDSFIGIPLIGCGLAGGDWNLVKDIIDEVTPNLKIEVVEYE